MKATVPSAITKTAKAAATDADVLDERHEILKSLRITDKDAMVADGYMLVIRKFDELSGLKAGEEILIPAEALANPIFDNSDEDLTVETIDAEKKLQVSNCSNVALTLPSPSGTFPNATKLMDDAYNNPEVGHVGFTVGLLKKLLDSIDDARFITFRFGTPIQPVIFKAGDSTGLIMPAKTMAGDKWEAL